MFNKLHRKDFAIAVKTGDSALDQLKFKKEATKGELFFNTADKKLYCATTSAGATDAVIYETSAFSITTDPNNFNGNGYSLNFDGVSDHASFTPTTFNTSTTWSFWYKFTSTPNAIVPFVGGAADSIAINPTTGYIYLDGAGGGSNYALGTVPGTTDWHHLVLTDDGAGSVTMYLDGVALTVNTSLGAQGGLALQYIARKASVYTPIIMDEVAHFGSILSTAQATNIWQGESDGGSGGTVRTPGDLSTFSPLHWWRMGDFEGGATSTVKDQGGSLDLTLVGASSSTDVSP